MSGTMDALCGYLKLVVTGRVELRLDDCSKLRSAQFPNFHKNSHIFRVQPGLFHVSNSSLSMCPPFFESLCCQFFTCVFCSLGRDVRPFGPLRFQFFTCPPFSGLCAICSQLFTPVLTAGVMMPPFSDLASNIDLLLVSNLQTVCMIPQLL